MNDTEHLPPDLSHYAALDKRLVEAVRGIHVLATVAWPAAAERRFLADVARGREALPKIKYERPDFSAQRAELDAIVGSADVAHPLGAYLQRSARSWGVAAAMLEAIGTPAFTACSIELYGRPGDPLPGGSQANLDAAKYFLSIAEKIGDGLGTDADAGMIPAAVLREEVQRGVDAFFGAGVVKVELDENLTAKAAAGATRIRLRADTDFSEYDRSQLLAHEAFVHTLTALNGRAQPVLQSLARASPRVTATQEGLAVFA